MNEVALALQDHGQREGSHDMFEGVGTLQPLLAGATRGLAPTIASLFSPAAPIRQLASPMHGGKSTGPRTPEGLERSRKARWVQGLYSREAREQRAKAQLLRRELVALLAQLR